MTKSSAVARSSLGLLFKKVFADVGFKNVRWQKPLVSPEGIAEFGQEFWQDFLECIPLIGIECFKE